MILNQNLPRKNLFLPKANLNIIDKLKYRNSQSKTDPYLSSKIPFYQTSKPKLYRLPIFI